MRKRRNGSPELRALKMAARFSNPAQIIRVA